MHRLNGVDLVTLQASAIKRQERNIKESVALTCLTYLRSPKLHNPYIFFNSI